MTAKIWQVVVLSRKAEKDLHHRFASGLVNITFKFYNNNLSTG